MAFKQQFYGELTILLIISVVSRIARTVTVSGIVLMQLVWHASYLAPVVVYSSTSYYDTAPTVSRSDLNHVDFVRDMRRIRIHGTSRGGVTDIYNDEEKDGEVGLISADH